jgi:hypothetical protein
MNKVNVMRFLVLFLFIGKISNAQQLRMFEQDSKWGFKDASGKVVIPAQYGTTDGFTSDGLAKVGNKEAGAWKYGVIDQTGKLVIPIAYDKLGRRFTSGRLWAYSNGKWGLLDNTGKLVVPFKYEDVESFEEDLGKVKLNGKWGFIDPNGVEKIPLIYNSVSSFASNLSMVALNSKYGFIDKSGKLVTQIKYDQIVFGHMAAALYAVRIGSKYAVINRQGVELTAFVYDEAKPNFNDTTNYLLVSAGRKWGMVDDKGTQVIALKYAQLELLNKKLVYARDNGKWGIITISEKVVLPLQYDQKPEHRFFLVPEGTFIENNRRKAFSLNANGDGIIIAKYDHIDVEADGRRAVYYKNKGGYINSKGQEVIALKYDSVRTFANGIALVALGGKFGLLDTLGKELVPVKYEFLGGYSEGLMLVAANNKWGFVDNKGAEVIALVYESAGPFTDGLAAVSVNKKVGFINKLGKMVIEPEYDGVVELFHEGRAIVVKGGKEITIGKNGRPIQ